MINAHSAADKALESPSGRPEQENDQNSALHKRIRKMDHLCESAQQAPLQHQQQTFLIQVQAHPRLRLNRHAQRLRVG